MNGRLHESDWSSTIRKARGTMLGQPSRRHLPSLGQATDHYSTWHWQAIDRLTTRIFRSPELAATIGAIVGALVPRFAEAAAVELPSVSQAPQAPDATQREAVTGDTRRIPLIVDGIVNGTLVLTGLRASADLLLPEIVGRCGRAVANARAFERERHVAVTFQNAALSTLLPTAAAYRFDAMYEAGRAEALVGGDWFDVFPLADGRYVISIGDVMGTGLTAAIAMVNVRQTVRGVAHVHPDPALMLEAADRTVRSQHPDRFVTAFVGVIDPVTQSCTYANAGHPYPFVRSADGAVHQIYSEGIPLGIDAAYPPSVQQTVLPPGSMLVLYTDGLIEATRDVLAGERSVAEALRDPAVMQNERIAQHLHDTVLTGAARDDVAILVVRVEGAPEVYRWRFDPTWSDAASRVHREMCERLALTPLSPERMVEIELVFSELIGNALRYAPGTVELIVQPREQSVVMHVLDKGPGFVFGPRLPPDIYAESGRGIFLTAAFANEFTVERRPGGGSHARATFYFTPR